jgi:hypothetical protein
MSAAPTVTYPQHPIIGDPASSPFSPAQSFICDSVDDQSRSAQGLGVLTISRHDGEQDTTEKRCAHHLGFQVLLIRQPYFVVYFPFGFSRYFSYLSATISLF